MVNKVKLRRPIKIGILFSVITIVFFEFGIYKFYFINKTAFNIFLLVTNVLMYAGFIFGTQQKPIQRFTSSISINKVVRGLFWIALIVSIPKFIIFTGIDTLDPMIILNKMLYASSNALDVYMEKNSLHNVSGVWRYINYVVVLMGPFYWAYTPLALLYWKHLSLFKKICSSFIWFLFCAQYVLCGTNVGVFLFFITFGVVYVIRRKRERGNMQLSKSEKISVLIVVAFVIFVLGAYFNMTMGSRISDHIDDKRFSLDTENWMWLITPEPLRQLLAYFTRYVASAYTALSMSFSVPFDSTCGVGNSFFLLDNIDPDRNGLWMNTYNMKLEKIFAYNFYANWHTPYVWFANDVSLFGVPFLFFLLFRYFGKAWRSFLETGNIVSFLIFMLFVEFMSFISANNHVFQQSDTLFAFWLLFFLNLATKRVNWKFYNEAI